MRRLPVRIVCACYLMAGAGALMGGEKPKVRAITGFVRLSPAGYQEQVSGALTVLRRAQSGFEAQGYTVEGIRLVTQPLAEWAKNMPESDALAFLKKLGELAATEKFALNVGPAMLRDDDDPAVMRLLAKGLATLPQVNASAIVAADDGIHWKAVHETARLIRTVADTSPHSQGNFNFAATAMLGPYGPFYPGAYHTGEGRRFSIGLEGASVVQEVFAKTHGNFEVATRELTQALTEHVQAAEKVGEQVAAATGWTFMGVDPTPAPLGSVSIGDAMEKFTGEKFGSSGTMTAALAITTAVKAVPGKRIGYAGLMVPVMEDKLLAQRWSEGTYNVDSLLAYSAVCGTGLDTIPLPGNITEQQMAAILGDVAALAWKWHKPLSARLLPVRDKQAGDQTEFEDPFLFNTKIRGLP